MRRYLPLTVSIMFIVSALASVSAQTPQHNTNNKALYIYGDRPLPHNAVDRDNMRTYDIMLQGNTSNCDFIALRNGIENIGGDGDSAYWQSRRLISQEPRDYKEGFYTLYGQNGSDYPFSLNNLGAAPEAFAGVYQSLGYDAILLQAEPHDTNNDFAYTIYQQLLLQPEHSFAHIWVTYDNYNPQARWLTIPETGESVSLLYPYHEIAIMMNPHQPNAVIALDGLVGYPYLISLDRLGYILRGFNSAILVRSSSVNIIEHQRAMLMGEPIPYTSHQLGGAYLWTARQWFGTDYQRWSQPIAQPYRFIDEHGTKVILPSQFLHFERIGDGAVTSALLGTRMGYELQARQLLPPDTIQPWVDKPLVNGIREWVTQTFGSVERFSAIFGKPITGEFWLSPAQMDHDVMRHIAHPLVDAQNADGYILVLTERALIAWHPQFGSLLVPLGQIYLEELRRALAQ